MFFAAGLYGAGLTAYHLGWEAPAAFLAGVLAGLVLRAPRRPAWRCGRRGVAFMIVTMMFAQACYLLILYFGDYTRGDEGFTIPDAARRFAAARRCRSTSPTPTSATISRWRCWRSAIAVTFVLVRAPAGRVLVAIRENEDRTMMLGYDSFRYKLFALVLSGTIAAAAGAAYALLFAYVGATFASIQYSIYPLLWTLLGGAGTVAGPFLGTLADVLSDRLLQRIHLRLSAGRRHRCSCSSSCSSRKGILGTLREKWLPWLP